MRADDLLARRRELWNAMWLALVPVGVAFTFGVLLLPRQAVPDAVPLPIADSGSLERTVAADDALASLAKRTPPPGTVRALGSALRAFHTEEANGADAHALVEARRAVDAAFIEALPAGPDALLQLRAFELDTFVREIQRFESSGNESDELHAVAGGFVRSMRAEGWLDGRDLAPSAAALRALFKQMWNAFVGVDDVRRAGSDDGFERFRLSLDEQRALYAFYIAHPHASPSMRDAIASAKAGAHTPAACQALAEAERVAVEGWRIERIARLSSIDPSYPAAYARGVANLRRGDSKAAASAFRQWLDDHPGGPLFLRAQAYLRAATDAQGML